MTSSTGGRAVAQTLVLANDTLVPNNFLAKNGLGPRGAAYDAAMGELFVPETQTNIVSVISTSTNQVIASVPVGSGPRAIAYVPSAGEVIVANSGAGTVSMISDSTNKVVRTVAVGSNPFALAWDSGTSEVYVVNAYSSNVSVISLLNNTVVATVTAGLVPVGIAYDNRTAQLFVTSSYNTSVFLISDASHQVVAWLPTGSQPAGVAYDYTKKEVFVANSGSDNVTVISDTTDKTVANVGVGNGPSALAYDSGKNEIFVANTGSNNVSVIAASNHSVVATISTGISPIAAAYSSGIGRIFVANSASSNVTVISDSNDSILTSILVGTAPFAMTYDTGARALFVANDYSSLVSVVDGTTSKVRASITVGQDPSSLAYDPAKNEVFVTNSGSGTVSVISDRTLTLLATIPVGSSPGGIAYDAARGELFVANSASSNVSVLSDASNTVVATIATGVSSWPLGVAYDPAKGEVFVVRDGNSDVIVISDTTRAEVATIPVGTNPTVVAYDAGVGHLFVANEGSANVSVISDATNHVVANVGLGSDPLGLAYDPVTGQVFATSIDPNVYATYLSPGNVTAISDATNTVLAKVQVGSQPACAIFDVTNDNIYVGNELQGTLSILPPSAKFDVTFVEAGLPIGTNWSIALNGAPQSSTTSAIFFSEPNGTASYSIRDVPGWHQSTLEYSGSVTVNGASLTEPTLQFTVETYAVTFAETGLPAGAAWTVRLNSASQTGNALPVRFSGLGNGTYGFAVSDIPGWRASPASGTVTVDGGPSLVSVAWAAGARYSVTFGQSGLPPGVLWSVNLSGEPLTSVATTMMFSEPNGSYRYAVGFLPGYAASPATGYANVSGSAVTVKLTFENTTGLVLLTFQAAGLASGVNWSVTMRVDGSGVAIQVASSLTRWSGGSGRIAFMVSDGNFTYSAAASGYRAVSGVLVVAGSTHPSISVDFVPDLPGHDSNPTILGLPEWAAGVGVAFVLIGASGLAMTVHRYRVRERDEGRRFVAGISETAWTADEDGEPVAQAHP